MTVFNQYNRGDGVKEDLVMVWKTSSASSQLALSLDILTHIIATVQDFPILSRGFSESFCCDYSSGSVSVLPRRVIYTLCVDSDIYTLC